MISELKKKVRVSSQGIYAILILNVFAAVFGIITSDSALNYIVHYGATYLYIAGLITGIVLYSKEKYSMGAEIVQWVGLGTMIISFANAIMTYAIVGTLGYNIWLVLLAILVSIILIVEALNVIRLEGKQKNSNPVIAIALFLIIVMLVVSFIGARELKIKIEIENYNKNQQEIINSNNSSEIKEKLDPNKEYENIEWGKTTITTSEGEIYKIDGNIISFTNGTEDTSISVLGTPEKLTISEDIVYILTKEGHVYYLDDKNSKFKFADVAKYNIVDIATVVNYTNETVYFLTEEGNLIDKNGVSYDKYSFVGNQNIAISELEVDVSFDKYGYIYYYNGLLNEYELMLDKANGQKITANEIFVFNSQVLIITKNNKLYSFDGTSNKVTFVKESVSYVAKKSKDDIIDIVIAFSDKTINIYSKLKSAYSVASGEEILRDSLIEYDAYEHHKDEIWSGVKTDNANIKNNKLYIAGNEILTGIAGNLKSVEEIDSVNLIVLYVLTDEGKAWAISLDKVSGYKIYEKNAILSGYKILDMTIKSEQDGVKKVYYLTEQGKLLDEKGNQYIAY